jgi:hypothetical protein
VAGDKLPWPYIVPLEAVPGQRIEGSVLEDRLDLCERGYAAGNNAAVIAALNICHQRNIPPPTWLHDAAKTLIAELIEPQKKGTAGRHSRTLSRMNAMLMHIHRTELVLRAHHVDGLTLDEAYASVAKSPDAELKDHKNPERAIEWSYNEGLRIANDPNDRLFIAWIYGSDVLLQHWATLTRRKGSKSG